MPTPRLIICDGICGSGKSSTAQYIARQLQRHNVAARCQFEGGALRGRALLRPERDGIPVPHRVEDRASRRDASEPDGPRTIAEKAQATPQEYIAQSLDRWRQFAREHETAEEIAVLDGYIFHGGLDQLLFIDADPGLAADYVRQIFEIIRPFDPLLIHLYQDDVDTAVRETCHERGRSWTRHQVEWKVHTPRGARLGHRGFAGLVQTFADLTEWATSICDDLAADVLAIENGAGDWPACHRRIFDRLAADGPRLEAYAPVLIGPEGVELESHPYGETLGEATLRPREKTLTLNRNPALRSLAGAEALAALDSSLTLSANAQLADLSALGNLRTVGGNLLLHCNPRLETLAGLEQVRDIGGALFAIRCQGLRELDALDQLAQIGGRVSLIALPVLHSLEGLRSLTALKGGLGLLDLNALTNLTGLHNLQRVDGDVVICYNDALQNLDGLGQLTHIEGNLKLVHNARLQSLDGLDRLTGVGDIYIIENEQLPTEEAEAFVARLRARGFTGRAVVAANGAEYSAAVEEMWP